MIAAASLFSVVTLNAAGAKDIHFECGSLTQAQVATLHSCKAKLFSEAAAMHAKGKMNFPLLQAHDMTCMEKIGCKAK